MEPTEDQLVEFKMLLDGNHPPAVAASKEYESSKDLKRFYSAILNVLKKKPKNFKQKASQSTVTSNGPLPSAPIPASSAPVSSASATPTFFGNGPPGMPAVSQGAGGDNKPETIRPTAVAPGMSDSRESFYINGLNGIYFPFQLFHPLWHSHTNHYMGFTFCVLD